MAEQQFGPGSIKDITPPQGMSPELASFIAANASPFTNPRDMPAEAKVPDPRNTEDTSTCFIWGHFEVQPHVAFNGTNTELVVMSNPDVLAPIPIWWSDSATVQITDYPTTGTASPLKWAHKYAEADLGNMVAQIESLRKRSKSYRVVGHGLKMWTAKTALVSNGNITCGQFDQSMFKNTVDYDLNKAGFPVADLSWWSNRPGLDASLGYAGLSLQSTCSAPARRALRKAQNAEIAFFPAEEGCTVRWTDKNDFQFQNTHNFSAVHPMASSYPCPGFANYEVVNTTNGVAPSNASDYVNVCPVLSRGPDGGEFTFDYEVKPYNSLGCFMATHSSATGAQQNMNQGGARSFYAAADNFMESYQLGQPAFTNYCLDSDKQFNTGLYADFIGGAAAAGITGNCIIQVVWHIEYVPMTTETLTESKPSPVDVNYETTAVYLRNRLAFPITVKGHSFFSSLRGAMSKIGRVAGRLFAFGGAVGPILASTGIPQLAAAGTIISAGSVAGGAAMAAAGNFADESEMAYKRLRADIGF